LPFAFTILQELYLEYDNEAHNPLIGRNEIITPMIVSYVPTGCPSF